MAKEKDNIRKDNAADDDYLELLKTVGSKAEASSQNEEASKEKNAQNEEITENIGEKKAETAEISSDGNSDKSPSVPPMKKNGEFVDISSKTEKEKNPFKRIAVWFKGLSKSKKTVVSIVAVILCIVIILGIFGAAFVIKKLNSMGKNIDNPISADDIIYDEDTNFTELDGAIDATGYLDALKEWATSGGKDSIMSSKNVINVLLIGADSRKGVNAGNTDVMMLISLNKKTKQIKLVSMFRDSYTYINNNGNEYWRKLNSAFSIGGTDCLINTIQNDYKIKIDNYVMVNFESFKAVIDAMGGVTVKVQEYEANYIENRYHISMPVGESVRLNGEQALIFSRVRGCDADADVSRTRRQRQVINAIMDEFKSASLTNLNKYVDTVLPYVDTGFSSSEILSLGMKSLMGGWVNYERSQLQMPNAEARDSGSINGSWIWVIDYQLAAHVLQTEIYGSSNITLEENRRTIIDIYKGRSATGGNNSGGGSTPIDSPDTTAAVSDTTESTSPVSESISDTQNVSESGAVETNVTEPETEVTEPATDTDVTEPALDPNPDGGEKEGEDKNQNQN